MKIICDFSVFYLDETLPKGTLLLECGKLLERGSPKLGEDGKPVRKNGKIVYELYRIKVLNTINFKKSMKYNPFAYLHDEKDILKLVNTLIANTKGSGEKSGEDFWVKAERLLYCALIGYIHYEAPDAERNFTTLLEMINASEAREDDSEFQSPVDLMFERLEEKDPEHFAVKQYKKFLLSAGKTRSSILISCGARLAPFDIKELRELMESDELELDTLGDRKTALFMCNWRRSLKLYSQVSQVMDILESEGYCFLFLTLTLRNCPWDELPAAIDDFLSGWRFMYHKAPIFRRAVCGTSRALEITVNHGARTYHPHLHVVLAVKPSYFKSKDYISQAQWTQLWRSCCDISYDPIVNIKRIKETSQGFKEISKYAVKGSDFLVGSPELMQRHVSNFLAGLSGRRLVGSTGVFKRVQRELCLDDPETGDLVITDGQQLRDDVYCMMVRYGWCSGVYVRR